jgi:hypothetical protein
MIETLTAYARPLASDTETPVTITTDADGALDELLLGHELVATGVISPDVRAVYVERDEDDPAVWLVIDVDTEDSLAVLITPMGAGA